MYYLPTQNHSVCVLLGLVKKWELEYWKDRPRAPLDCEKRASWDRLPEFCSERASLGAERGGDLQDATFPLEMTYTVQNSGAILVTLPGISAVLNLLCGEICDSLPNKAIFRRGTDHHRLNGVVLHVVTNGLCYICIFHYCFSDLNLNQNWCA